MTSDTRRNAIALLAEVWALSPDVRLGQLVSHLGFLSETHIGRSLDDVDDDELVAVLQRHKAELEARAAGKSHAPLPSPGPTISTSGSPINLEATSS